MPQPESWSSDWRIRGLAASSSSWRIETGSAATQPNTRHIPAACYPPRRPQPPGGRIPAGRRFVAYGHEGGRTEADLVGTARQAVRARAAGRRRQEPPSRAAGGGDRLPEGGGSAPVHLDDDFAP